MLFLLLCLLGVGASLGTELTACKIADNVKAALYILDIMPADHFQNDHVTLINLLKNALVTGFPNTQGITSLPDDELFNLASMLGMIRNGNLDDLNTETPEVNKQFWLMVENKAILRLGFEQLALLKEEDSDRKNYLSAFMADLSLRDVLALSCSSQSWTVDARKITGYKDGCYSGSTFPAGDPATAATRYNCINQCRTAMKKLAFFTVGENTCKCASLAEQLGTFLPDQSACSPDNSVAKTGLGVPIKTMRDPEVLVNSFDPADLGFPDIAENDLIDIKQVFVEDGDATLYFVALLKFAVVLFKIVEVEGVQTYVFMDSKRWDSHCNPAAALEDFCLQRTKLAFPSTPERQNQQLPMAITFETLKLYVTLSAKMELNTAEDIDAVQSNPAVKTDDPMVFPGGKMVEHILISHNQVGRNNPFQTTLIRLEKGKLLDLQQAFAESFYGNYLPASFLKVPRTLAHRVIGRKTYLFVGSHLAADGVGKVHLYTMGEELTQVTDFAGYSRIVVEEEDNSVSTFFVSDILYAQTIFPFLIVLDSEPANKDPVTNLPTDSRIRVYRISQFTQFILVDDIVINDRYTSISFVNTDSVKYLMLKSATGMGFLEISTKGKLSTTEKQFAPTFSQVDVFQFGRLQDNVLIPTLNSAGDAMIIYDMDGNEVDKVNNDATNRDYKAMKCITCHDSVLCLTGSYQSSEADGIKLNFDMFKFLPYSKLGVVSDDITFTTWEAAQQRIDNMFTTNTPRYTQQQADQNNYLMNAGSTIPAGSSWNVARLDVSQLTVSDGGFDGTAVFIKVKSPTTEVETDVTYTGEGESSPGTNVRRALEIHFDQVQTKLDEVVSKTGILNTTFYSSHLDLSSTEMQTISNTNVNVLSANLIKSTDSKIKIDELKSSDETVKSLKTLIAETFLQNAPQPLAGTKQFNKAIKTENLDTGLLSDDEATISPEHCFVKNKDTTITTPQTFVNSIEITALVLEGSASIEDTDGFTLVKEDLVPHVNDANGLPGFFSFGNNVTAQGLNAHVDGFVLDLADISNMALKESANIITGDIVVNIAGTDSANKAIGTSILLEDGALLNNVDLLAVKADAVRTSCEGCTTCGSNCASSTVQVFSPVAFTGALTAASLTVTNLNSRPFSTFITTDEFSDSNFEITGEKTLTDITVQNLEASLFHGLDLKNLMTTNSEQDIEVDITFDKTSEFASINAPVDNPCVPIDGKNLCLIFKSDLAAVNAGSPWITENTIDTDIKFNKISIAQNAAIMFEDQVNSMTVGDVVDKIVTDEDKEFEITGTKTITKPITLQAVTSHANANVNLIVGDTTYTINDFVNTRTTQEVDGAKHFSSTVNVENLFTVGSALINDLSVAHLLHCFVDKGNESSTEIHIHHPISFDLVSLPRVLVQRDPDLETFGIVPKDDTFSTAGLFVGISVDGKDETTLKNELVAKMLLDHEVVIPDGEKVALDIMFTHVLRTSANIKECDFDAKRAQLNQLLNTIYGLTMSFVSSLSDLQVLQYLARNPMVNRYDPSTDLALLSGENQFCSASPCIQNFQGGIAADTVTVSENINILDSKVIHNIDVNVLNADRVSLSQANTNVLGRLDFSSLSLNPTGGVYSGNLEIGTSDGFISSDDFPRKFLNTASASEQTVRGAVQMGAIDATTVTADSLQVAGVPYDLSALDAATYNLDADLTFSELTFTDTVTIHNPITLEGLLDGVDLAEFHDAIVVGEDIEVVSGTTIAGTNRATLDLTGSKTMSTLTVANLIATQEEGLVYPEFLFPACQRSEPEVGKLVGEMIGESILGLSGLRDCHDKCREQMCYGLSYKAGENSECLLFLSIESIDETQTDYTSQTLECCMQFKAQGSEKYLTIDGEDKLTTSNVAEYWCFENSHLVHKATDKYVSIADGETVLSDVPRSGQKEGVRVAEAFTYVEVDNFFQIKSLTLNKWLNKESDDSIILGDLQSTSWQPLIGGVRMSVLEEGVIQPRVLLNNVAQTVSGALILEGGLTLEGTTLITPSISTLTHDAVAAIYSWNSETMTHEIGTDYTLTGDSLAVTNLKSDAYNADLDDFILLNTTAVDIQLNGKTTFTDTMTFNINSLTVGGNVAGHDIADLNTNVARNTAATLDFTELNTFKQNDGNTAKLTATQLTASVDMALTDPQIQGGVDLSDLRSKTILNDETEAVNILGKVEFNKIVIAGGALNLASPQFNGVSVTIPDDIILRTDSEVDLTNHKVGLLTANQALTINGQFFGYNADKFLDVLYKDGDQTITADFTMSGNVSAKGNLQTGTLNGYDPQDSLILLDGNVNIASNVNFQQTLNIKNVVVTGTVNTFDFLNKFRDSIARVGADNQISEKWTLSAAKFEGAIVGTAETNNTFINDQRVSDLNKAAGLYNNIHAVKISAQAEASVLCEFVSDLQDSYLSEQEIVHYKLIKSQRFEGKVFTSSKLKSSMDGSQYVLFAVNTNANMLEVYDVVDGSIIMIQSSPLSSTAIPRIDQIVDISENDGEFTTIIFVSTGVPSLGVIMFKFAISSGSNSLTPIGALPDAMAVTEMGLSNILAVNHITDEDNRKVSLSIVSFAALKECGSDCGSVVPASVLDACGVDNADQCIVDSNVNAEPKNLKARVLPTGQLMVVFNQKITAFGDQEAIRVLLFEHTSGGYSLVNNMIESSSSKDFSITVLDAKVFLVLSGSKLEMKEVKVDVGSLVDKDLSSLEFGIYTNIMDGKDIGSENGVLVVKDGNKFVDLKYSGTTGLQVLSTLKLEHNIRSLSCANVVDSDTQKVVFIKAFVGKDMISILQADLANPVSYVQFECAQPEVPSGWNP
jgi:hypothetical protein